jgi:hypothetical protein
MGNGELAAAARSGGGRTERRPTTQEGAASQGVRDGGGILCYGAAAMALQFGGKKRLGGLLKMTLKKGLWEGSFIKKSATIEL